MRGQTTWCKWLVTVVVIALGAGIADATDLQDLVRLRGHDRVVLQGLGIVIGLDDTGDTSKDSFVAVRPYAELLGNLGDPVGGLSELSKAGAFAIVMVQMEIPPAGAIDGTRLDVSVDTLFNAESLAGGRLVFSPLRLPRPHRDNPPIMAFASGPITLEGGDLTSGRVRDGGQMIRDIKRNPVDPNGRLQLVLKEQYAGYPMSARLANLINSAMEFSGATQLAVAENAVSVNVTVPNAQRQAPASFIAALMSIPVDPSLIETKARIVVNERTGTILVTSDVEIGPVAISHAGLTITTMTPEPEPSALSPQIQQSSWLSINAEKSPRKGTASTHLDTLLEALRQFNVPVKNQIEIIYELKRSGALHAEIIKE
ncbi:MAG: flagellar basal body P-ring protein FlgI [Phycisphaerales bacterium]|nr:flagellar basal body P-ring protein FlgI [Phycisphaerales bacterium]